MSDCEQIFAVARLVSLFSMFVFVHVVVSGAVFQQTFKGLVSCLRLNSMKLVK